MKIIYVISIIYNFSYETIPYIFIYLYYISNYNNLILVIFK